MKLNHSEQLQCFSPAEVKNKVHTEHSKQNVGTLGKRKKFEWKPFHVFLIIYGLIALAGIAFWMSS